MSILGHQVLMIVAQVQGKSAGEIKPSTLLGPRAREIHFRLYMKLNINVETHEHMNFEQLLWRCKLSKNTA